MVAWCAKIQPTNPVSSLIFVCSVICVFVYVCVFVNFVRVVFVLLTDVTTTIFAGFAKLQLKKIVSPFLSNRFFSSLLVLQLVHSHA
jgi:hypothetical protein